MRTLFLNPLKVVFLLFSISLLNTNLFASDSSIDIIKVLKQAEEKFNSLNDYTAIFIKQQKVNGKLLPREEIMTKFKKPFCVYYKWLNIDKGREVIYVDGKNNNKFIAHLGGAISIFPVAKWMHPTDPLVMATNKYPITRSGIGNMIKSLLSQYELAKANNDLQEFSIGSEKLDGRDTHVIIRRLPKKKEYACYLSIVNIDKQTMLPIRVINYDWDFNLEETYYYKDLEINQGLTDKDFDPNNKKYDFGLFKF